MANDILIGRSTRDEILALKWANRHGLIAGATGTGKTVTLQVLAEGFSKAGVPVFLADVKGDLSGMCLPGADKDFLTKRATQINLIDYKGEAFPVLYWDLFGEKGHPVRTTLSEMGPLLLSRILDLNDTQEGVLNIAFHVADTDGLLLLDLKDLRALLSDIAERADEVGREYGHVAPATIGTIQRKLLELENQSADKFFGEPALDIQDLMQCTDEGQGYINILAADKLMQQSPRLYATFLLWLLSELFEELPEAGDLDKPKLVFFFDEAHLLFNDAPKHLLEKIEQVVRLIRSKGVGVYFVTQSPTDIPQDVAAQLSNRVQHALRAFTPQGQRDVKVAAETLRANPEFDTAEVIDKLAVGEALVSVLEGKGEPSVVARTLICPPRGRLGVVADEARRENMNYSPVKAKYTQTVDRESAYEKLKGRAQQKQEQVLAQRPEPVAVGERRPVGRPRDTLAEAMMKSTVRTIGSTLGREIIRGVLGSLLGGRGRSR